MKINKIVKVPTGEIHTELGEKGIAKGEICNREGCKGIIESREKEGQCTCHISAPCTYCCEQTEYCPVCGWSAEEEQDQYYREYAKIYGNSPYKYKSDKERFDELKDGEFGYINISSGSNVIVRLIGKHPNMTTKEIFEYLHLSENPEMPRMIKHSESIFELTYFCD